MRDNSSNQQPLPPGYEFHAEKLRVERVLGAGGFGITYLVRDLHVDDYRVLKENFPKNLSLRASGSVVSLVSSENQEDYDYLLQRFIFESEQLQRFSGHPNIANVVGSFRANNTAYMLMSYRPGKTLAEHIQQNDNHPLNEDEIKSLCLPVLKGLQAVHAADLLHLDIKPENIYIPSLVEPYLIDFGGARHFSGAESQRLSQYSSMVRTPGYAPPEQSSTQKKHQAATDLYAFGATLYYAISSQAPIDANDRRAAVDDDEPDPLTPALKIGAGRYSKELLQAIDACLRIKRKERPQSVAELVQLLPPSWRITEPIIPDPKDQSPSRPDDQSPSPDSQSGKTQFEAKPTDAVSKPAQASAYKHKSTAIASAKGDNTWLWMITIAVLITFGLWYYDQAIEADKSNWRLATRTNSIAGYQNYLDDCGSICNHRRLAIELMEQLREFKLTIRSNVYSDEVTINGRSYGSTPVMTNLARGTYAVRVSKAGYRDYFEQIEFTQELTLRVELEREYGPGDIIQDCPQCPKMVYIPAGSFRMGDIQGDGSSDAKPVHRVSVGTFLLGQTEVTVGQFRAFVDASGYQTEAEQSRGCRIYGDGRRSWSSGNNWRNPGFKQAEAEPVVCVNVNDIQRYIRWLSAKTNQQYRLPSEAEWEYAARAGSETKYSWGNKAGRKYANYGTDTCCGGLAEGKDKWRYTAPVGSFAANAFGLYDMHGNVWELTQDCRNDSYHGAPSDGSAWLSGNCDMRMWRGGSWDFSPNYLRSSERTSNSTAERYDNDGFRLARAID